MADLRHGSNSLNSDTKYKKPELKRSGSTRVFIVELLFDSLNLILDMLVGCGLNYFETKNSEIGVVSSNSML